MTEKELYDVLEGTGLKVAYHHFDDEPPPPYLLYYFTNSDNVVADDDIYCEKSNYVIEVYTREHAPEITASVDKALRTAGISYSKEETYLSDEKVYETNYDIEIIGAFLLSNKNEA